MLIDPLVLDRIFAAADQLYQASDDNEYPTVDAVRKLARAGMNDTCTGMKAWRQRQAAKPDALPIEVPPTLQQSNARALQTLWEQATSTASEALRAAQSVWQRERQDADAISQQTAEAFDAVSIELETKQSELDAAQVKLNEMHHALLSVQQRNEQLASDKLYADAAIERERAVRLEIEQRAQELSRELEQVHGLLTQVRLDAAAERCSAAHDLAELRAAHERMLQQLAESREQAAALSGALRVYQQPRERTHPRRSQLDTFSPATTASKANHNAKSDKP